MRRRLDPVHRILCARMSRRTARHLRSDSPRNLYRTRRPAHASHVQDGDVKKVVVLMTIDPSSEILWSRSSPCQWGKAFTLTWPTSLCCASKTRLRHLGATILWCGPKLRHLSAEVGTHGATTGIGGYAASASGKHISGAAIEISCGGYSGRAPSKRNCPNISWQPTPQRQSRRDRELLTLLELAPLPRHRSPTIGGRIQWQREAATVFWQSFLDPRQLADPAS